MAQDLFFKRHTQMVPFEKSLAPLYFWLQGAKTGESGSRTPKGSAQADILADTRMRSARGQQQTFFQFIHPLFTCCIVAMGEEGAGTGYRAGQKWWQYVASSRGSQHDLQPQQNIASCQW